MDDNTFFNYFTIEKIFINLVKLEILERWLSFDKDTGADQFNNILKKLESSYEFPEEF